MVDQVASGESGTARDTERAGRRWSRRQRRFAFQLGCLPSAVLAAGMAVGAINLVTYRDAPSWVYDVRGYLIGGHLAVTLGTLAVLQLLATWLLGVLAAVTAAQAISGPGVAPRPRLRIARRRVCVAAWATLALRLMLLGVVLVVLLLAFTNWLGSPVSIANEDQIVRTLAIRPVLPVLAGFLLLVVLVAGPFLRMRYSTALGVLAAALTPHRERRAWTAASARLGAGLAGALALTWGAAGVTLLVLTAYDPFSSSRYTPMPQLFPFVPNYVSSLLTQSAALAGLAAVVLAGQIGLPPLYVWLAGRVLRRRSGGPHP